MKTLQLFETNEQVELKKFAGGECHVKIKGAFSEGDKVQIHVRLNSSDDLMNLCLCVDALRHMGVIYIEALIPYMPYARQDRVMVAGDPLSIRVAATIINALNLNKISVFDAHSDVTPALLNNCHTIPNHNMITSLIEQLNLKDFVLVSPDLGAYKKIDKLAKEIGYRGEIATGIKVRDLSTGQIIKSDILCNDLKGKTCLVVDDICDGGRTFIELGAALKEKNAGNLYLIVSHGIFSHNALDRLKDAGYTKVCSSDSISAMEKTDFYKPYHVFK